MTKKCFKCGEVKPLSCFYKHPRMKGGRVNKCKECNKRDVRENRASRIEYYRRYDRERGSRKGSEYTAEYRERFPNKYRSHGIVARAIRAGNLVRQPCEVCGYDKNIHAHHDDYAMPLNVRWLCPIHHREWHDEHGEGDNAI